MRRTRSSRIWACTITSSAVVGSSASSTFGLHASAMRDRGSLAHAARELVRIPVGPVAGDADELEQLAHLRPGGLAGRDAVQLHRLDDLRADPS